MEFKFPWAFMTLLIIPVLIALYARMERRRARYAQQFASLSLLKETTGKGPGIRRHLPFVFFLLAVLLLLIALTRPIAVITLPEREGTVILAIDVSGSMRADDFKPNRIEAAKTAARTFINNQSDSIRVGIVSFSSYAALVLPPTTEKDRALLAVNRLTLQRRTAIGDGILSSLDAIFEQVSGAGSFYAGANATNLPPPPPAGTHVPAIIILLTDGQSNTGISPLEAAQRAVEYGVRIYTIGVGTVQGATLQSPGGGGGGFRTVLDEKTLQRVAEMTDAKYFHASDEEALLEIYRNIDTALILHTERTEVTFAFTAAGVVLMMIGALLPLIWFNRMP